MGNSFFHETNHLVKGLAPLADRFNASPATDVVNMKLYQKCTFIVHIDGKTASTLGTAKLQVEECTSAAGAGNTAIAFKYSKIAAGASDTSGAITAVAAATGVTTTANEHAVYVIEIDQADLSAGSPYVRLQTTEVVNAAVAGSVMIVLSGMSYAGDPSGHATALT